MQTYAFLIKAKAKATDAKHLFCWLSAKSDSRAEREIANILEDAEIETGRGAPYLQPVRTDWPVVDDLPEEGKLDNTWCDRYELNEDGRSWKLISRPAPEPELTTSEVTTSLVPVAKEELPTTSDEANVPLENRGLAVRIAIHLLNDKYQTHITKAQQIAATELSLDESNSYMHNLLQAISDVAEFADLSLHVEWKLVQAVKAVFPQDGKHASTLLVEFVTNWISAEPDSRNQLVEDWQSGNLPAKEPVTRSEDVTDKMEHPAAQLGFRQQFLAAYICDEFAHHVTADQRIMISDLMLDVDNHYVQNLMLAAENVAEAKKYSWQEIWKLTDAVKKVFAPSARHELGVVLRFMQAWAATHHIDRGLLVKEWQAGKRVAAIQRTDSGTTAGGGIPTDRNPDYIHTLDTLDEEIAAATLPMDFDIYNIPGGIHRRAKEIISGKESPWKEWSDVLRKTPGILDYSRAAIFAVIRSAHPEFYKSPGRLSGYINAYLTETDHANPTQETLVAARQLDSAAVVAGVIQGTEPVESLDKLSTEFVVVGKQVAEAAGKNAGDSKTTTEVANLGNGVFSIDNLMGQQSATSTTTLQNEAADDVQMEETGRDETQTDSAVPPGEAENVSTESGAAARPQATAVDNNIDTGHQINDGESYTLMTHVMVDLETMGNNPEAPIIAIGAVFFDPGTGKTGEEFYQIVSLESAMEFGAKPDAATIIWWMKQSAEARAAITGGDAISLMDAIDNLDEFIHTNSANGIKYVQLWGNGSSFDNVILRRAYEQVGAELSVPFWNDRDVRTIVELGKVVGINPRYQIPFDGDMHNALADARHQVKYVSAIWQKLTQN
ncbi:exonuclease [Phytobacter diazotrophicus]|uniref:exonuclease n=1 Tax=Phytobacter diazotrophicus TaxID=395631 RepID=UPI00290E4D05|nr:3'-5' exoribonuclease [Enterobacteriaceae bacterium]